MERQGNRRWCGWWPGWPATTHTCRSDRRGDLGLLAQPLVDRHDLSGGSSATGGLGAAQQAQGLRASVDHTANDREVVFRGCGVAVLEALAEFDSDLVGPVVSLGHHLVDAA